MWKDTSHIPVKARAKAMSDLDTTISISTRARITELAALAAISQADVELGPEHERVLVAESRVIQLCQTGKRHIYGTARLRYIASQTGFSVDKVVTLLEEAQDILSRQVARV